MKLPGRLVLSKSNIYQRLRRLYAPFKRKFQGPVDFIICGVQKGGTSALDAYLREHPQISMAFRKEVHFFDKEKFFQDGRPDYTFYHSYFPFAPEGKIVGECTPIYCYWNQVPERIKSYNPDIKIIVLLRNPIDRAYSHWNMERLRGNESLSFSESIRSERDRLDQCKDRQHRVFSYVDRGFYSRQLSRIYQSFSADNVLVLKSEMLKERPNEVLNEVFGFLGVEQLDVIEDKSVHVLEYQKPIDSGDSDYLRLVYEPELSALQSMIRWDCSDWLDSK